MFKTITKYTDYDKVLDIYDVCFSDNLKIPRKDIEIRWRRGYYHIFTDKDIRVFSMVIYYNDCCHIDYLGVKPECQGQGLARLMLEFLISKKKPISLECEPQLIPFYKRFGFEETPFFNVGLHVLSHSMTVLQCRHMLSYISLSYPFFILFPHLVISIIRYSHLHILLRLLFLYRFHFIDGCRY